jgi:hypothetical protein
VTGLDSFRSTHSIYPDPSPEPPRGPRAVDAAVLRRSFLHVLVRDLQQSEKTLARRHTLNYPLLGLWAFSITRWTWLPNSLHQPIKTRSISARPRGNSVQTV